MFFIKKIRKHLVLAIWQIVIASFGTICMGSADVAIAPINLLQNKINEQEESKGLQDSAVATKIIINASADNKTEAKTEKNEITGNNLDHEDETIYLNFENAGLANVVNYLAERKGINVIPHKDLESQKVTLTTRNPMTLSRAWNVLLTLLEMNGFSIIDVDGTSRIVSSKDNGKEPLPYYSSMTTEPEDLPDSDLVVRYIYFLKNMSVEIARGILEKMLDGDRRLEISKELQACIIKEKCLTIKAAMKVIKELDTGGLRESIRVIHLQEADAKTVEDLFKNIIDPQAADKMRFMGTDNQKESTYFSSTTKITADSLKNNIILMGTEKNIDRIVDFIYRYIDVAIDSAESRIHIKEIRYVNAESLVPLLKNIVKPPQKQTLISGQFKFFEDVVIVSDSSQDSTRSGGNRLIIAANNDDWQRIEAFIEKLDKPEPQVAMEVMIAILTNSQTKELGAQLQTKNSTGVLGSNRMQFNNLSSGNGSGGAVLGTNTAGSGAENVPMNQLVQLAGKSFTGLNSPTYLTLGNANNGTDSNIWAILRAVLNLSTSNIISQPFLVANNGEKALVSSGSTQYVQGPLITSGINVQTSRVPTKARTEFEVTPQINKDGVIDLTIKVTLDDFQVVGGGAPPRVNKCSVDTKATMMTGEVLVLGGFKESIQSVSVYKTPVLGDIPIIGNLFRSTSKVKSEGDLYVFIRPSVIKPQFEGGVDEYTQLKIDYSKYQMLKNDYYATSSDPIQRWFFKPQHKAMDEHVADVKEGRFRPIDDFANQREFPKSVSIAEDPFFRVAENIKKEKTKNKKNKKHNIATT